MCETRLRPRVPNAKRSQLVLPDESAEPERISPSFCRQQVNADRCIVVVSVTIASIGNDLPTIVYAYCRHQQDLRIGRYEVTKRTWLAAESS
jgi:hypothetical protein